MSYRLLCTDIDGTLVNGRKEIPPRTAAAIRAAFAQGKTVTLATGRMPGALGRFAGAVPGTTPLICGNGAALYRAGDGAWLRHNPMSRETTMELLRRGRERGADMVLWQRDTLWLEGDEERRRWYERGVNHVSLPMEDFFLRSEGGASKLLYFGAPEAARQWERELTEGQVPGAEGFTSDAGTLEIVRADVDKGCGVRQCGELLGVPVMEIIAVGDGRNDIPMLRAAGLAAAMENAGADVKAEAEIVIPSNEEEGVAWLIEHYLLD